MSPLPPNVAIAAEKLFAAHRASGTVATAAATDDLRALLERFGIPWIPFIQEDEASQVCRGPEVSL